MVRHMAREVDPAQESIVLASFDSRHAAEHMVASLGRGFRKKARKGQVAAFIVRGNKDGSLKLTQSRVLTVRGLESALIHASLSWTVGFMGLRSQSEGRGSASPTPSTCMRVTSDRMSEPPTRCSPALERTARLQ